MAHPTLDNPDLYGRLRSFNPNTYSDRGAARDMQMHYQPLPSSQTKVAQPLVIETAARVVAPPFVVETAQPLVEQSVVARMEQPVEAEQAEPKLNKLSGLLKYNPLRTVPKMYAAMAVVVFLVGVFVAVNQFKVTNDVHAQTTAAPNSSHQTASSQPPDETPPNSNFKSYYLVPPDQPKFLDIDKIGVSARIRKLGVDSSSNLLAPRSIYDAGWYEESAKPGDGGGAILLDGHVSGPTKHGVFYDLKKLNAGDVIKITRGDNQVFSFKVVQSKTFNDGSVDMASTLVSAVPGKLGLNLMTCMGQFDSKSDQYKQRLVVYAVAI